MRSRWIITLGAVWSAWLCGAPGALAQETSPREIGVSAELERRRVYVGDRVRFQVTVSGSDSSQAPSITLPEGIVGQYLGEQNTTRSSTFIFNGRRTDRTTYGYVYQYDLYPQQPGDFVIGPIEVEVEGETYTTNRATLAVVEPQDVSAEFPITAELHRADLWQGEAIPIRVTWYVPGSVESFSFEVTQLPESVRVLENRTPPGRPNASERRPGTVLGQDLIMDFGRDTLDGQAVRTLSFDLLVTPTEAGVHDLGPVGVVFDRVIRGRGRPRVISRADPIPVTVRPLPQEGRPAGFAGMIGAYEASSEASMSVANVGDPITLTLTLEGDEPMIGADAGPDLSAIGDFADAFQLAPEGWERVRTDLPGRRIFQTTIRPVWNDLAEIPPIVIPYFDAEAGTYREARTDPIPLDVRAVREITAADALISPSPTAARSPLNDADDAFWAHDRGPAVLTPDRFDPVERVTSPVWVGVLGAPPAAYAVTLATLALARARDPEHARRRRALANARSELRRSGGGAAARRLVADLAGRTPESVTAADASALPLDTATRDGIVDLIQADEATRFGAHPPTAQDSSHARRVLRDAHRQCQRAGRAS